MFIKSFRKKKGKWTLELTNGEYLIPQLDAFELMLSLLDSDVNFIVKMIGGYRTLEYISWCNNN